jgi:hypothetical protein
MLVIIVVRLLLMVVVVVVVVVVQPRVGRHCRRWRSMSTRLQTQLWRCVTAWQHFWVLLVAAAELVGHLAPGR